MKQLSNIRPLACHFYESSFLNIPLGLDISSDYMLFTPSASWRPFLFGEKSPIRQQIFHKSYQKTLFIATFVELMATLLCFSTSFAPFSFILVYSRIYCWIAPRGLYEQRHLLTPNLSALNFPMEIHSFKDGLKPQNVGGFVDNE